MEAVAVIKIVSVAKETGLLKKIAAGALGSFFLLIIIFSFFFSSPQTKNIGLSDEVLQYSNLVAGLCDEYGIPDFVDVVLAVMMQESGGRGDDPMQSSECEFNTEYPKRPNGITNPEYSVRVGIQYIKECLRVANCTDPSDTDALYLALQGFNFGKGYITWAVKNYGEYTAENAKEFAKKEADRLNWDSYGDPEYVPHVTRYLTISNGDPAQLIGNGYIKYPLSNISITSRFGNRGSGFHGGVDFGATIGTPVYACADGEVVTVYQWTSSKGTSGTASWGTHVKIKHAENVYTLYAHNSSLTVTKGQKVKQGDLIAYTGNTGKSSGPHLHLELYLGGNSINYRVDPIPYLKNEKQIGF